MDDLENKALELSQDELEQVTGGKEGEWYKLRLVCNLEKGYLAIRNNPSYDTKNEVGCLFNGDTVFSKEVYCGDYVMVYAVTNANDYYEKKSFKGEGWVNSKFLS